MAAQRQAPHGSGSIPARRHFLSVSDVMQASNTPPAENPSLADRPAIQTIRVNEIRRPGSAGAPLGSDAAPLTEKQALWVGDDTEDKGRRGKRYQTKQEALQKRRACDELPSTSEHRLVATTCHIVRALGKLGSKARTFELRGGFEARAHPAR